MNTQPGAPCGDDSIVVHSDIVCLFSSLHEVIPAMEAETIWPFQLVGLHAHSS